MSLSHRQESHEAGSSTVRRCALETLAVVAVVAITVLSSCTDIDRPVTSEGATPVSRSEHWSVGPLGNYTLPTPPDNLHSSPQTSTGIVIPTGAPVKFTVSGLLNFSVNGAYATCSGTNPPNPPWGTSIGPAGYTQHQYQVILSDGPFQQATISLSPSDPNASTIVGYHQGGSFTLYAGEITGVGGACGSNPINPEYTITGTQTVAVEILDSARATPNKNPIIPGDTVTFTLSVPWTSNFNANGATWTWVSDTTGVGTAAVISGCGHTTTCSYKIFGKGHVVVTGVQAENAVTLSAVSQEILVQLPTLTLTASPRSMLTGDTATFTASVSPSSASWGIGAWTWTPDSASGGINPNNCTTAEKVCKRSMALSGSMKVTAVVGTDTLTATTHVSVLPCLTGDSLLDDSRLRKQFSDALNGSNPNAPALSRVERGGVRWLLADGSILDSLLPIGPNDTPCSFNFPSGIGNVGQPLLTWHVHPFTPMDTLDPLPYDPNVTPHSPCPKLAYAKGRLFKAASGPTIPDDVQSGFPAIVVEKNGSVWVSDAQGHIKTPYPRSGPGACDALSR